MPIIRWNQGQGQFEIGDQGRPNWTVPTKQELLQRLLDSRFPERVTLDQFLRAHPDSFDRGIIVGLQRRHIISWSVIREFVLVCANRWVMFFTNQRSPATLQRQALEIIRYLGPEAQTQLDNGFDQLHRQQPIPASQFFTQCAIAAFNYPANVFIGLSPGNQQQGAQTDLGEDIYEWDGQRVSTRESGLLQGTPWQGLADVAAVIDGILQGAQ